MSDSLDASCGRCGYVLRGLPAGSHCPECALPTDWSLGVHALHETQRNDRAWARQLHFGVLVLLLAQIILVSLRRAIDDLVLMRSIASATI